MTRLRIQLEPAYLLATRPYGDSSLLLEAFTHNHGRVGMVAKGARGPKSKLRGLLQALQPLLLSWSQTGELGTLTGAESIGVAPRLAGERVFYAWYLNELVLKLLQRQDPHPRLFDHYAEALCGLAGEAAEQTLRLFEKRLLTEVGYGLPLPRELDAGHRYAYDPEHGITETAAEDGIAGASLIALRDEQLNNPQALADARKLTQTALRRLLGGKPLETPRLLREMKKKLSP